MYHGKNPTTMTVSIATIYKPWARVVKRDIERGVQFGFNEGCNMNTLEFILD